MNAARPILPCWRQVQLGLTTTLTSNTNNHNYVFLLLTVSCSYQYLKGFILTQLWTINRTINYYIFNTLIVHLNIIFSYMKFNKIFSLYHPVNWNYLCWFSATCTSEHFAFCIITHMGDSILKKTFSTFLKWPPERLFVYNIIWLHLLFGYKSNMDEYFCS